MIDLFSLMAVLSKTTLLLLFNLLEKNTKVFLYFDAFMELFRLQNLFQSYKKMFFATITMIADRVDGV